MTDPNIEVDSRCDICKSPIISYCNKHEPSRFIRFYRKLGIFKIRIKLFFTGARKFNTDNVDDMIALDDYERTLDDRSR